MTTIFEKEILQLHDTRDFALYLNGQLVGFAQEYQQGEAVLDALVYELSVRYEYDNPPIDCAELAALFRRDKAAAAHRLLSLTARQRVRQALCYAAYLNDDLGLDLTIQQVLDNWERGLSRLLGVSVPTAA